ncbi:MAG: YidC/Oxa1 family membrane protein insertase [Ruminococcaceae bacterium]|nr:YidC/Oxa1 family membrane protein insertase [Oscillospiraceae bacterium]
MNTKKTNKRIGIILICMMVFTLLFNTLSMTVFADKKDDEHVHEWKYESVEEGTKENKEGKEVKGYYVTRECQDKDCKEKQENKFVKKDSDFTAANGWMEKLAVPFGFIIKFFYDLIPVYAVALLFFAVAMKVILFPFGIKQQKNSIKQAKLRPKEMAIRKKYAGRNDKATQQKVQEEIMALYQKENFNPMSGCLPLLLQMPILFALFRVIYNPLRFTAGVHRDTITAIGRRLIDLGVEYKGAYLNKTALRIGDLPIATLLKDKENLGLVKDLLPKNFENPDLSFLGIDLSKTPTFEFNLLIIIPIATFIIVYLSMWLTRKLTYQPTVNQTGDAGMSTKIMDLVMPAMSTYFTFLYPAVLGLYWIFQNILSVLQQLILKKMYPIPVFTEEDYAAAEKEMAGKNKKDKKKNVTYKRHPKSLHHIDDDDDYVAPAKPEPKKNTGKKNPESANPLIDAAPLKDDEKDN